MKDGFCVEKSKRKNGKYKGMGIRWNLFAFLALFTVFVLLVVYVFQVLLLAPFYESEKKNELRLTASVIEANILSSDLKKTIYTLSGDYSICAILYDIDKGHAKELVSSHISSGCVIHNIDARNFGGLYNKALSENGEYMKTYSLDSLSSTVYVKTITDESGKNYVLFLNADLAPVSAAIKTYTLQFRWISLILLAGALIFSFFMSKIVATPIIRLSRSVKKLAKGNYEEVFDGNGYREVRELSDALNYASEELSKSDELKKELIANVSHDLRTPLTMIRGYTEMMRDIPGENNAENAQIVIDETNRLSELVGDMLDLSRVQSGTRKINAERFDIADAVRKTMSRYEKLTEKDGYDISFICEGEAEIIADRTMMLQVIYNLINNAVNYTGEDKKVTVRLSSENERVRFSVTDTGSGIPKAELPYIWDRYYKVDKVHRRATVGTGLGLSIVKGILEAHGAVYGVESTPNVGSTFWFELPKAN